MQEKADLNGVNRKYQKLLSENIKDNAEHVQRKDQAKVDGDISNGVNRTVL